LEQLIDLIQLDEAKDDSPDFQILLDKSSHGDANGFALATETRTVLSTSQATPVPNGAEIRDRLLPTIIGMGSEGELVGNASSKVVATKFDQRFCHPTGN